MSKNVLFLCSEGKLRSRTGELLCLFGGVSARGAGTASTALVRVTDALVREADLVVCMQPLHSFAIADMPHYDDAKVVILGIPDHYARLEPELVRLLVVRTRRFATDIAAAMERGSHLLASQPGYQEALGTRAFELADNPAFRVLPSV